jgi:hypothetical protein
MFKLTHCAAATAIAFSCSTAFLNAEHTCASHQNCGNFYSEGPWVGSHNIEVTTTDEVIYSEDFDNCSCGSMQWTKTDTKTVTHTVKVEGSASATIKAGFLTGLVVKSQAQVNVGGGYESSTDETVTISINKTAPQCSRHTFKQRKTKKVATGFQIGYEEIWWDNNSHTGECNAWSNTGSSTGWSGGSASFTQPGTCEGAPCASNSCS